MALPNGAGGYQLGDGNLSELTIGYLATPQTATATATLTAAQVTSGMLVANPSATAAVYTLPTSAAIDAIITSAKVGSTFVLRLVNIGTSSGTVTLVLGTGMTDGGNALVAVAITSSAVFTFRKTADAAYTVYRG
jgi:hypothetical protein